MGNLINLYQITIIQILPFFYLKGTISVILSDLRHAINAIPDSQPEPLPLRQIKDDREFSAYLDKKASKKYIFCENSFNLNLYFMQDIAF